MSYVFILARQRSGVRYLNGLLQSALPIEAVGEVLEPSLKEGKAMPSFWEFQKRMMTENPDLVFPWNRFDAIDAFLAELQEKHPGKHLAIDVKYNSAHHFEQGWGRMGRVSAFVEFARAREVQIIHLYRQNVLEQIISNDRARETGRWHQFHRGDASDKPEALPPTVISVDAHGLPDRMRNFLMESRQVQQELEAAHLNLEVKYEKLWRQPAEQMRVARAAATALGETVSAESLSSNTIKIGGQSLQEQLANYDEVASALTDAGLERFLTQG